MTVPIRHLRETIRVSQEQLARRSKVPRFRLSCHERGFLELRPDEKTALRDALKDLLWERSQNFFEELGVGT
jgi:hypothetical protein